MALERNASLAATWTLDAREDAIALRSATFAERRERARAARQTNAEQKMQHQMDLLRRHDVLLAQRLSTERMQRWLTLVALSARTLNWCRHFAYTRDSRNRLAAACVIQKNWRVHRKFVYEYNVRRAATAVSKVVWNWRLHVRGSVGWPPSSCPAPARARTRCFPPRPLAPAVPMPMLLCAVLRNVWRRAGGPPSRWFGFWSWSMPMPRTRVWQP
jgi:hypothetical protein